MAEVRLWNDTAVQALTEATRGLCADAKVEVVDCIDSTNTELMRRGQGSLSAPILLVALSQSAGRGRMGREWLAPAGHGLTFSWGMPMAVSDWSGLSLAVGLSMAEALDPQGHWGLRLKWPNDLWWQPDQTARKLGGILIETQAAAASAAARRWCVVGVGLNLLSPPTSDWQVPPVGWCEITGEPLACAPAVLQRCVTALLPAMSAFERHGFAPLVDQFALRDALRGLDVALSDGRQGRAMGVDAQGAMLLQTPQGLQRVHSADVSVRPQSLCGADHV
ncbi:MAG: biotin--[acetyl-CoA-carboxylase] ligase [Betaproteobacteria bacterium]|nr:biotin--[acetyl-CoA-carboxylase] ligase [Betaproteobacteria bacterium]NBY04433.1 biotin--[acetyl-CoA-carboxylase] ligase [Betaproteobacteria bacterium]